MVSARRRIIVWKFLVDALFDSSPTQWRVRGWASSFGSNCVKLTPLKSKNSILHAKGAAWRESRGGGGLKCAHVAARTRNFPTHTVGSRAPFKFRNARRGGDRATKGGSDQAKSSYRHHLKYLHRVLPRAAMEWPASGVASSPEVVLGVNVFGPRQALEVVCFALQRLRRGHVPHSYALLYKNPRRAN